MYRNATVPTSSVNDKNHLNLDSSPGIHPECISVGGGDLILGKRRQQDALNDDIFHPPRLQLEVLPGILRQHNRLDERTT